MSTETKETAGVKLGYDVHAQGLEWLDDPRERELAEYAWGFYAANGKDMALLAKESQLDRQTVHQILTGAKMLLGDRRGEAFDAIAAMKSRIAKNKPLVRTVVTQKILDALDYVRDERAMSYVSGTTGRGKTYAAEYWAAQNNHGRTKFLRAPAGCTRRTMIRMLAKKMGFNSAMNAADTAQMLFERITDRTVIIIDEAGHLLGRNGISGAIEFIRDLHDHTHCPIFLIFTDVYLEEIKNGKNTAFYEQFLGRFEFPVEIPALIRKDEVRTVIRHFMPDANEETVDYALGLARTREGKLRTLFKDLYRAEEFARSSGRKMTVKDLKKMVAFRRSGGSWPEDQ